jgi:Sugar (and other) transporter
MVPVYVAEMAVDKHLRGHGVNSMIAFATVGACLAYWVDFGMVFTTGPVVWRFPVAFQVMWSILCVGLIWNLPDTPRWYYAKSMTGEGDAVLSRLHGKDITDPAVELTKSENLASIELEMTETESLRIKDFFWDTSDTQAARRIRTGIILFAFAYLQGLVPRYAGEIT